MQAITDPAILHAYLSDASNLQGQASQLYRPRNTQEVAEVLRHCAENHIPLTVSARRSSTTGAPVPMGGAVLSTENLNRVLSRTEVEAGVILGEYQKMIE